MQRSEKLKICLLGGSNSLVSHGLKRGIASKSQLLNLAVGGTSSLQNIFAFRRTKQEIETSVDAIVTESNVNDTFNVTGVNTPIAMIKSNIEKLYRELALTEKPVAAIILPIRRYNQAGMDTSVFDEVKACHLQFATQYGCHIIDVDGALTGYTVDHPNVQKVIRDPHHILDSFMYELGANVARYFSKTIEHTSPLKQFDSNFQVILSDQLSDNCKVKSNSLMNERYADLSEKKTLSIKNGMLVGVATWSDGQSEIKISEGGNKTIKQFNSLVAFNDFTFPFRGKVSIESVLGKSLGVTEKSNNVVPVPELEYPVSLIGFLVENDHLVQPTHIGESRFLPELIPDETVLIKTIDRYILLQNKQKNYSLKKHEVDVIRDAAVKLEKVDVMLACELMAIAHRQRPGGPLIKAKLMQYREELAQQDKRKHE